MTCGDAQDLFTEYLDGQVRGSVRTVLDAHLTLCEECAVRLRGVRAVRNRLAHLERRRPPDTFGFAVRRMLLQEVRRKQMWIARIRGILWPTPQTAWAAAVGSVVAVASFAVLWFAWTPSIGIGGLHAGTSGKESAKQGQSVRYVLEHLPVEGNLIESTAKDTVSRTPAPAAPTGAQPVSASF